MLNDAAFGGIIVFIHSFIHSMQFIADYSHK